MIGSRDPKAQMAALLLQKDIAIVFDVGTSNILKEAK
jgi:hypothetical protein